MGAGNRSSPNPGAEIITGGFKVLEIKVKGMSCAHCAAAVTRALSILPGVTEVQVDLAGGRVTYQSQGAASRDEVAKAIKAAGYEVAA
jgi:copper chaperone